MIRRLLKSKADPNLQDSEGNTPLHLSADEGHREVFDILKDAGGRPDIRNKEGKTAYDMVH